MFDAVFSSLTFGNLLCVGFVAGGIFAKEDLTAALMDAAGGGWVVGVEEGECGWILGLRCFVVGLIVRGRGYDEWLGLTIGCFFFGAATIGIVVD